MAAQRINWNNVDNSIKQYNQAIQHDQQQSSKGGYDKNEIQKTLNTIYLVTDTASGSNLQDIPFHAKPLDNISIIVI